jgi:hypothetical protein
MIYELRKYELQQHNKKAFYERFDKQLMPILERIGFRLVGAWDTEIGAVPETTYILAWNDLNERQEKWALLNSDPDWTDIKKTSFEKHGALVLKTHSTILNPTSYSPLR